MGYQLGLDGGGTKTECVVSNAEGRILSMGRAGPSNPLRCGFEAAFQSLSEAASEALREAKLQRAAITGVCAGLAGAGRRSVVRRTAEFLSQEFPGAQIHVITDYEIALEAAVGAGPGVVLIAGTGSVSYGRNAEGETARAGGYGPWVGDEGSAFDIGRRAVGAGARTRDMAAPATPLSSLIPAALNCSDWDELTDLTMKQPDEVFPKLFPVVAAAAEAEDSAAKEILFTSAIGLANLAMIVVRKLGLGDKEFSLVKCGGVFGRSRMLDSLLDSVLSSGALRAKISRLEISPAAGAARLAQRLLESPAPPALHDAQR